MRKGESLLGNVFGNFNSLRAAGVAALTGSIVIALGAGCPGITPPPDELPDDAYSRTDDPFPDDAEEIDEAQYDALVAAGEWEPVTPRTPAEQAEAEAEQDAADEATVAAYLAANPLAEDIIPPEPDPGDGFVQPLEDGNYLLTLNLRNGDTLEVVTMGRRFWLRTVAEGRRRFPTRENQLMIFRSFYDALPDRWRTALELPDPDDIESDAAITADDIRAINGRLGDSERTSSVIADLKFSGAALFPPAFLSECDEEMGATPGGDLSASAFDGTCDFDPDGIVARYDWSLRDNLTCVKSQGSRGTCTGFANTASIETLAGVVHGLRVNLSEQAYYNRARTVWDGPGGSIDGHMSEVGFREMAEEGFLLYFENQWPYNPSNSRVTTCTASSGGTCTAATYTGTCTGYADTCSDTIHQSAFACVDILQFRYCGFFVPEKNPNFAGFRIGNSAEIWDPVDKNFSLHLIKLALTIDRPVVLGHPVTGAISAAAVGDGFVNYVAGDTIGGGHGMMVAGFIDNEELEDIAPDAPAGAGGGYLIVKNSWGNCSGDGGFLYIPYQSVLDYAPDVTILFDIL